MDPRFARRLTLMYPAAWRARYSEEFAAFLEDHPSTIRAIADVICSALRERISAGGRAMDGRQRALALMAWSYLVAVAAGVNFYWIIDDTAVVDAMRNHPTFSLSHELVAFGSFIAFAAVVTIALPVVIRIVRASVLERRRDVIARVAVPFVAAAVTLSWLAAATYWGHGRWGGAWVPTPWDVNGTMQRASWPPVSVRLVLASVTSALLVIGLLVSGVSVEQAIRRTDLSRHRQWWFTTTITVFAGSTLLMTVGIISWGWFAARYAADAFHAGDGLLIDISMAHAWLASTILFAFSVAVALKASRSAFQNV